MLRLAGSATGPVPILKSFAFMAAPSLVCKLARSKCHESTLPAAGVLPGFLCRNLQPEERAQGMPGASAHPQPCVRKMESTQASHHRFAETVRHSPRDCFTAYSTLSPAIGLFVTVPAQCEALSRVDASVEASGPHGFAVRERRIRL